MGVTVLVFAAGQHAQKVCTTCISFDFWERTGASFKVACMWKGQERIKNPFLQNLHRDITVRTQWKSKLDSTGLTSTIEVLRKKVELSNTRTAYVMHSPNS